MIQIFPIQFNVKLDEGNSNSDANYLDCHAKVPLVDLCLTATIDRQVEGFHSRMELLGVPQARAAAMNMHVPHLQLYYKRRYLLT